MKTGTKLALALAFGAGAAVLSLWLGAAELDLVSALLSGPATVEGRILYYARLPRTAAAMLSGSALAVSGCVIQGVLGNRLASPGIIGVNAGAGLAVTILCALGTFSGWVVAGGAFLGALAAALAVTLAAQRVGASRATVILGGVAVNSFLNALSEAVTALVPDAAALSVDFRVGGFSGVSAGQLVPAGILIIGALILVLTLRNELDVMTLGEETAQGLGLPVKKARTLLLALAAVLAGASVSFAGLLGFVGLIVPHMARRLVGGGGKELLPMAAVLGAGFVTACDLAARLAAAPYELSAGIVMSIIGGPFFCWLLLRKGGGHGRNS